MAFNQLRLFSSWHYFVC